MNNNIGELQCETKITNFVDYGDLEEFLAKAVGVKMVEITESPNDTDYEVNVEQNDLKLNQYQTQERLDKELKEIEDRLKGGGVEHWRFHQVFKWLLHKQLIKPGTYVVRVSW